MPDAATLSLALTNMLAWGLADIAAKLSLRRLSFWQLTFFFQGVSLLPLLAFSLVVSAARFPGAEVAPFLFASAILNVVAYFLFNFSLARGRVSIVTPVASTWGVVATVVGIFIFGELVPPAKVVAIVLTFLGLSLVSVDWENVRLGRGSFRIGALPAMAAMISWAIVILLLKPVSQSLGGVETVLWFRLIGVAATAAILSFRKTKVLPDPYRGSTLPMGFAALAGTLDVVGFVSYTVNIVRNDFSTVVPIVASNSAVAVVAARAVFGDVVRWWQAAGILLILTGIVGIALQ